MTETPKLRDILTGKIRYANDQKTEKMLTGIIIRSAIPHGNLISITYPYQPEGIYIFTAKDVPGSNYVSVDNAGFPLLAAHEVNYIGEPIAVVFGDDVGALKKFCREIIINFQEEDGKCFTLEDNPNTIYTYEVEKGTIDEITGQDGIRKFSGTYSVEPKEHFVSETQCSYAHYKNKKLYLSTKTQWLYHVKKTASDTLDIPQKSIEVSRLYGGKNFDKRIWYPSHITALAALGAYKTGKSVFISLNFEEELKYAPKSIGSSISIDSYLNEDNHLVGIDARVLIDMGAYGIFMDEIARRTAFLTAGVYQCKNIRIQVDIKKTNKPPLVGYLGFGAVNALFSTELHTTRLAKEAGIPVHLWKREKVFSKGNTYVTGNRLVQNTPLSDLMDIIIKDSDFNRKFASYNLFFKGRDRKMPPFLRGIGISSIYKGNGFVVGSRNIPSAISVTLDKEGAVIIRTSIQPQHNRLVEQWKKRAGDILDIPVEKISLITSNTEETPDSGPGTLSRGVGIITGLIEKCCQSIKKKRFRDPLPITEKRSFRKAAGQNWDYNTSTGAPFSSISWAASVVEVEVNPITMKDSIRSIWLYVDCGAVLDSQEARKVLEAEIYLALEWTRKNTTTFEDGLFSLLEPPGYYPKTKLAIQFINTEKKKTFGGIEGLAMQSIPAAYAAALSQAVNRDITSIPPVIALPEKKETFEVEEENEESADN